MAVSYDEAIQSLYTKWKISEMRLISLTKRQHFSMSLTILLNVGELTRDQDHWKSLGIIAQSKYSMIRESSLYAGSNHISCYKMLFQKICLLLVRIFH